MYYDKLDAIRKRMAAEGIDFDVATSWKRERLNWATGISLVVPLEVRNEDDLAAIAQLARRILLGKTTVEETFPDYCYKRSDWVLEQKSEKNTIN
jgi:hypothetical protein